MRMMKIDARYSVSDDGTVWSCGMPLVAIDGVGVNLHGKRVKVAYLVARAFVPNRELRAYVRHKNGDMRDNRAKNLEWCDEREVRKRGRRPEVRWIRAWRVDGEPAGCWGSVVDASSETGAKPEAIRACLAGRRKMAGGLLWRDV